MKEALLMKWIIVSLMCLISTIPFASPLQTHVDGLINRIDPAMNIGVQVLDLSTGETLYRRNAEQVFTPASNMKLFSDAAALMALGPDYQFVSQLSTDATTLDNGILKGSVYVHFPGDPSFTHRHLDDLFAQLSHWGIKAIQGNIVLVSNNRTVNAYAPGWVPGDLAFSYGAPLAPLILDENRLSLTVNPAARIGELAIIEMDKKRPHFVIDNQVHTTAAPHCHVSFVMDHDNHVAVRGCIGLGASAVQQGIAIQNPLRYAQDAVNHHLTKRHIRLQGDVVLGAAPRGALLLASHYSKPISQLMADTLKPSDNLYADSLFLHAATKLHGTPLNWQEAQPVIKQFLQDQTGINMHHATLIDGSGLSRNDLLTPKQTVDLLSYLYYHFPLAYEYIAALPISGQDGTLQRRLRKPGQQGFIRAKTGTMTGVVGLSGYLYTANAHTLAFSMFINRTKGTKPAVSGQYRPLLDALCDYFLQQKIENNRVVQLSNPHARVAYQQAPTEAEKQHHHYAKWRNLEYKLKAALKGQAVTILFRGDQLVLHDKTNTIQTVWNSLQSLTNKYTFAIALQSATLPIKNKQSPYVLWIKDNDTHATPNRTWTIREAI